MAQWNPNLPTLQQSLPGLQGARFGQDLMQAYLQNQAQQQQNVAQPGLSQAKLAQMLAQTRGQNIQNIQAPELLKIRQKAAENAARSADVRDAYIQLQLKKLPYYLATGSARMANLPAGQVALGQDPSLMSDLMMGQKGLASQLAQTAGATGAQPPLQPRQPPAGYPAQPQGMPQQGMPQQQPQTQMGAPQLPVALTPEQQRADDYLQQGTPSENIPEDVIKEAQDATLSKLIRQTTPNRIQLQRYYEKTFEGFGDKISELMPTLSKYAGPKGALLLKKDQLDAATGKVNPNYEDYLFFKTYLVPQAANELRLFLGGQASDKEAEMMMKMIDPSLIATNPQLYQKRWENLIGQAKTIGPLIRQSLAQISGKSPVPAVTPSTGRALSPGIPGNQQQPITAAPSGTVEMITQNGESYAVPHGDVDAAIKYGWRRANG